ncbi:MAG: lactamase [Chloroflexi bacterium]|nr:MAG: lactamase [Chloroflexota bacterium]
MEISWLGHSCFRIKGRQVTLVTDPYDESFGHASPGLQADIVTVSHDHRGHNCWPRVEGNPKVVSHPGEYEISDVFIVGLSTFHDANEGQIRGKNTAYLIEMEDVHICHLGDLGHTPSSRQVEELSDAHVLLVPVGGVSTIDAKTASEIVRLLNPNIVIPMHYQTETVSWLEPLNKFVNEMGLREVTSQPRVTITRSSLPSETSVIILERLPA